MKKTIKFICDFITSQREDLASLREKEVADLSAAIPKAVLLTCPYPLRFIASTEKLFVVSSYGGAIAGNEATLDYAINTMEVPILLVLAHEDCSALQGALKGTGNTQVEQQLFAKIAPAFAQGKARKYRDNVMKHLDYQISLALERYRAKVKGDKLLVVGLYCDKNGKLSLANYNGLRGTDSLVQALPDVGLDIFLEQ